ncbi:hypothetical protein CHRY9390_00135 [Chryseobacterium aquaeductus]|uniref:Lipid/polyisoprenoid-binding YceI-like domain-containing protein n=1 Tax=Chryseobacterium aquaeductus TaxID=2675056 RepID=A0A9N8MKD4_9FLAO|nr:hypothetical protein [Chryseobacterium aquaeductus]CAA7329497.1 hypothetical protein CHRY9390_00135 [Chryseobacterium potabilaquae]CAD7797247.1 hypothetical protein CHRY9390_00135 [Chryseobacterium aquaeductus]
MKIFLFLLFPFFTFYAQTNNFPLKDKDFSRIILNEKLGFEGEILDGKIEVIFVEVIKDSRKTENYSVKGTYTVNGKTLTCSGKLTFNHVFNVKDQPDQMLVFGDFYLNGTQPDIDDGIFKGKFRIQTTKELNSVNKSSNTTFKGVFENFESGKKVDFWFANFYHSDISKVIFK